jgi:hypothetical protein
MAENMSNRWQKIIVALAICFAAYNLIGFLILPAVMKSVLEKKLSESLKREVSIESIRANPYYLTFTVKGFKVKTLDNTGTFISFAELFLNIEALSIVKWGPIVKELRLNSPYLAITRNADLSYNFADLITARDGPDQSEDGEQSVFSINNIQIYDGKADFDDRFKGKKHELREFQVAIPFISNMPNYMELFVQPAFSAIVNDTAFNLKGTTKPFLDSRETSFRLNIKELDLTGYLEYSPIKMDYLLNSALLSIDANITYIEFTDKRPTVTLKGGIDFNNISLKDLDGTPMIDLPLFSIVINSAELFSRKVHLSKLLIKDPLIDVIRSRGGKVNLLSLIPEQEKKERVNQDPADFPFALDIDVIKIDNAGLSFSDFKTARPFKRILKPIDITLSDFTTQKNKSANLLFAFSNKAGETIEANGSISINPITCDLKLQVKRLDISQVQSYLDEMLRITITRGFASTSGRLKLREGNSGFSGNYKGGANLTRFASINKLDAEDFLKWESLSFTGMDIGYEPIYASIDGIALSDFYSRLIINPDGRLNLQEIIVREEKEEGEALSVENELAGRGEAMDIRIDTATLQGGRVNFTDMHITPKFSIDLLEVGGRVSGLSSAADKLADVDLIGKLDKYAPLEITGKVNPLADDLYADITVAFKDFDLSSLTPYSGKYIGYKIEKGKLVLDLKYLIEKRKLVAKNNIFIDQITLGETVESEDATKLPVAFAISLLKNRRGEIKLDLPVSGSIDDPEFRIGGIIIKMFVKMVLKAVTSPFALLGALVGGGEELSYVEFDPGSHTISESGIKKLDSLITALYDRPNLKLEVEGYVDIDNDKESLRQLSFDKSLKAEKLKRTVWKSKGAVSIDEVVIEPKEYEKYLWKAYKKADFPKPKTLLGLTKKISPAEMEKLMLTHTKITDDDLRQLAGQRSKAVKDYILTSEKVAPERVFIVWPKGLSPKEKGGIQNSRVDFKLK